MNFEWEIKSDGYVGEISRLKFNKIVLIEAIKYADDDCVHLYGKLLDIFPDIDSIIFDKTTAETRKYIEDMLHTFCVTFSTWWAR